MKHRYGLVGLDGDGTLYAPSGWRLLRLPFRVARVVQAALNAFAYVGA